ncbi:MAG TPA: hypothetical protein VGL09_21525 [Methylomirabilota bacterium]
MAPAMGGEDSRYDRIVAKPRRRRMVGWYDPGQLLSTGVEVLISLALGQRSDYRTLQSVGEPQGLFDYTQVDQRERRDLWFDYMADTGDGWDATFAMACLVSEPSLSWRGRPLHRGEFLIIGGDEVYPVASKRGYQERLVEPLTAAFPGNRSDGSPQLYAIPGNHDWYDGLVSFSRLFMRGRFVAGWRTMQARSYFALKLPHRWWLWAVDVQLESDIDPGQFEYFRALASAEAPDGLRPGDRVILATAEPDWLYRDIKDPRVESNLGFLEKKIIEPAGARVHVWVAGDVHNYRRHENTRDENYQRIVSGGGGAYLAPTHTPMFGPAATSLKRVVRIGDEVFRQRFAYPNPATSFRLSLMNVLFLLRNWRFGLFSGLAYCAIAWGPVPPSWPRQVVGSALEQEPIRLVWLALVLAAFIFYADWEFPVFRWVGGALHAVAHITAAFAIARLAAVHCVGHGVLGELCRVGTLFVGGALVGPLLLGLYLLVSSTVVGAHSDHAFAALRIPDFKHFLRFYIGHDGVLEIFPIGIPRVPRGKGAGTQYMVLEGPIRITPAAAAPPPARSR